LRRPENAEEKQYLNLIKKVLATPERMIFGHQMRFSLNRFPLLTTKKMFWRGIAEELLWFISGDTNNKTLTDKNIHIWSSNLLRKFDKLFFASQKITSIIEDKTENKTEDKIENKTEDKTENKTEIIFCEAKNNLSSLRSKEEDLGPIYGYQWRRFGGCFDQLAHCINLIKTDPNSRRIVMSAWNPLDIPKMALPPCHVLVQFHVSGKKLSAHMYQRSADIGLGMPFNISSYSLLIYLIAQVCDLIPYEFIYSIGNTHIYKEHESALKEQLTRRSVQFPILKINNNTKDIDNFKFTDFELVNYNCYSDLKMPLIV
jgi:thymidylate synthase